jgi:hypothetical protein
MLLIDSNTYRIDASRGDDHKIRFTVKNSSGMAYDVSANTFKFTVKLGLDDAIANAKFQKQDPAGNGIDLTNATVGIVDVNLVPADTGTLSGPYYYDFEMTESAKIYTLRQGMFFVKKDVSTSGTPPTAGSVLTPFPGDIQVQGGQIYIKDTGTGANAGKYWKLVVQDGVFDVQGPSVTVPF